MIKCLLFDLDGTLVPLLDIHFNAFNSAIKDIFGEQHIIPIHERALYDSFSTKQKIEILKTKYILEDTVWNTLATKKQEYTKKELENFDFTPYNKKELFEELKFNYSIGVCTNSIKETAEFVLDKIGIKNIINFYLCNEDVVNRKPNPEIYWKAMNICNVNAFETFIFEDSEVGMQAAIKSGAFCTKVKDSNTINKQFLNNILKELRDNE